MQVRAHVSPSKPRARYADDRVRRNPRVALMQSAQHGHCNDPGCHPGFPSQHEEIPVRPSPRTFLAALVLLPAIATADAGEPGAAIIVVDDGEVLYRGARGMANLELGVALAPDMVFRRASITKQFTCATVLLLEERGELPTPKPRCSDRHRGERALELSRVSRRARSWSRA